MRARPSDSSIRAALNTDAGRRRCREISIEIADQSKNDARSGCALLAAVLDH